MQETSTVEKVPVLTLEEELDLIEKGISKIDYSSAKDHGREISDFVDKLRETDPDFGAFYQEVYFEGVKLLDPKYVEDQNYSHVNEKGIIVKKDGETGGFPSGIDVANRHAAYLATLKYYTELKKENKTYEQGNVAPFKERLASDLSGVILEQERKRLEGAAQAELARKEYADNIEKHRATMHKEVVNVFNNLGIPLNEKISRMLMEPDDMQGGRAGSGYTNAFRELGTYINNSLRNPLDLFDEEEINIALGQNEGPKWTREEKIEKLGLREKLAQAGAMLPNPSHVILTTMIHDIVFKSTKELPLLNGNVSSDKVEKAGTCTTAERYYFEWRGVEGMKDSNRGYDGHMKIITDPSGKPLLIEKIGMGEKTCITLTPLLIEGVEIPEGSMVQAIPKEGSVAEKTGFRDFAEKSNLDDYEGFKFLRISTLSLPPELREQAFGNHYQNQIQNSFVNYDWLETRHYRELAENALEPIPV